MYDKWEATLANGDRVFVNALSRDDAFERAEQSVDEMVVRVRRLPVWILRPIGSRGGLRWGKRIQMTESEAWAANDKLAAEGSNLRWHQD